MKNKQKLKNKKAPSARTKNTPPCGHHSKGGELQNA